MAVGHTGIPVRLGEYNGASVGSVVFIDEILDCIKLMELSITVSCVCNSEIFP